MQTSQLINIRNSILDTIDIDRIFSVLNPSFPGSMHTDPYRRDGKNHWAVAERRINGEHRGDYIVKSMTGTFNRLGMLVNRHGDGNMYHHHVSLQDAVRILDGWNVAQSRVPGTVKGRPVFCLSPSVYYKRAAELKGLRL